MSEPTAFALVPECWKPFLKEPTTLTDDDVMELLTFIFHSEAVQKKLDLLIANRKELGQPNGS